MSIGCLWAVLVAWWVYADSRPLFQVEVEGAKNAYARFVVKTEEQGWREASPYWFPAYILEEGKGRVFFRLQPGVYTGFRFALERGNPLADTASFRGQLDSEIPSLNNWERIDGREVIQEEQELPLDQRPREVATWQWESDSSFVLERAPVSDWIAGVAIKSGVALIAGIILSLLIRVFIAADRRWGNHVMDGSRQAFSRVRENKVLRTLILFVLGGGILWASTTAFQRHFGEEMFLQLEMTSSAESTAQVFFRNKEWFHERKSSLSHVIGSDLRQTFFFPLGRASVRSIRLDPLMRDGVVLLHSAEIVTGKGRLVHEISLGDLHWDDEQQKSQIADVSYDATTGVLKLRVAEGSNDPNILLLEPGNVVLHSAGIWDSLGIVILWVLYFLFLARAVIKLFIGKREAQSTTVRLFLSRSTRYFLLSAGATVVLLVPTVYFLEFFESEASYLEMSATASDDVVGIWRFQSGQETFLHRDYPFSLKTGQKRVFDIALPRSKVHHYKLEFTGGERDTVLDIDTMVVTIPGQNKHVDLLREEGSFRWVNPPAQTQEDGGWQIVLPAGQKIWFLLEDDSHSLEYQPLWLRGSVLAALIVVCFVYLWRGRNSEETLGLDSSRKAARYFLGMMLFFGVLFMLVTPPFQTPDEPRWLDRSWHLSEGHWFPQVQDNLAGGEVPTSLRTVYQKVSYDIAFNPHRRTNLERWKDANQVELQEDEVFFARMGDNTQSLLPYLPQSIGFRIGKALGLTPLEMTYAARAVNLLLASLIVFLAIRIFPVIPWTVLVLFLSPIMVFLYGSANHDPITNSLTLLFIAYVFLLRDRARRLNWGHCLVLIGLIAAVITSKFIYVMLAGLLLILPRELFRSAADRWIKIGVCWAVMIGITLNWLGLLSNYPPFDYDRPEVDQTVNISILKQEPEIVGQWILNTYPHDASLWREQFVGILGWLDTPLPTVIHLVWWLAVGAAFLADAGSAGWRPGWLTRGWILALLGLITATIILLFYLIYTEPGLVRIQGIQGRYLLPLLPLVFAMFAFRWSYLKQWAPWLRRFAVCGVALVLFMTLILLRYRYWDIY